MTWKEQVLVAILAGSIALGAVSMYVVNRADTDAHEPEVYPAAVVNPVETPPDDTPVAPPPEAPPTPVYAAVPEQVVAEVKGAVNRPGVYELSATARVEDLLDAAGGAREDAMLDVLNRAARLIDGSTLLIPSQPRHDGQRPADFISPDYAATMNPPGYLVWGWQMGHTAAPPTQQEGTNGAGVGVDAAPARVNLNTASQAELETLPRVGPVTAGKIIDYRRQVPFTRVDDLLNIHGIGPKTLEGLRAHVTVH